MKPSTSLTHLRYMLDFLLVIMFALRPAATTSRHFLLSVNADYLGNDRCIHQP